MLSNAMNARLNVAFDIIASSGPGYSGVAGDHSVHDI
jgi:hypothetical protein